MRLSRLLSPPLAILLAPSMKLYHLGYVRCRSRMRGSATATILEMLDARTTRDVRVIDTTETSGGLTGRVLLVGAHGQVGRACAALLRERVVSLGHGQLDIGDRAAIAGAVERYHPAWILNCAGATEVDRCEQDHEYADGPNWHGPRNLAELAARNDLGLIHISTDYVFDGGKDAPYVEEDPPRPINYYGLSKLRGEEAVLSACPSAIVVRTSWVFGEGSVNFPSKVMSWAAARRALRIAADQWGSPTFAPDLAEAILALLERGANGIYHLAGRGCASRFELARKVLSAAGLNATVEPATSSEFPLPARRPKQTCLDCAKGAWLGVRLPSWEDGVVRFVRSGYCENGPKDGSVLGGHCGDTTGEGEV